MWAVVGLFALVTVIRSQQVGIPIRDPGGSIFVLRVALSLAWFAALIVVDAGVRVGRNGWTFAKTIAEVRRRWTKERLVLALSGMLAYHLVYLSYHNLKSMSPSRGALRAFPLLRLW